MGLSVNTAHTTTASVTHTSHRRRKIFPKKRKITVAIPRKLLYNGCITSRRDDHAVS